jgi:hypothetical protein
VVSDEYQSARPALADTIDPFPSPYYPYSYEVFGNNCTPQRNTNTT